MINSLSFDTSDVLWVWDFETRDVVIAGAVRTPIGKFGGSLAGYAPGPLGALAVAESLRRAGLAPEHVDELVFGCARQAGAGPNVARQVSYKAGIPQEKPAFTVNMACAKRDEVLRP